jgi:hypothetical protein
MRAPEDIIAAVQSDFQAAFSFLIYPGRGRTTAPALKSSRAV